MGTALRVADFRVHALDPFNFRMLLEPLLCNDSFLLNVSVDVSSAALIELCHELGARYLDSCIEPWAGGYTDIRLSPPKVQLQPARAGTGNQSPFLAPAANGSRYARRQSGTDIHFTKHALLDMARDLAVL